MLVELGQLPDSYFQWKIQKDLHAAISIQYFPSITFYSTKKIDETRPKTSGTIMLPNFWDIAQESYTTADKDARGYPA